MDDLSTASWNFTDYSAAVIMIAAVVQALVAYRLWRLQHAVESARNACLLYVRAIRNIGDPVRLSISNLSDYDLWIDEVELFVTRCASQPGQRIIAKEKHLSRGHTESGVPLQDALIIENGNIADPVDIDFHVVVRAWARDRIETRESPRYNVAWGPNHPASLTVRAND
jgi:hypothetical protein